MGEFQGLELLHSQPLAWHARTHLTYMPSNIGVPPPSSCRHGDRCSRMHNRPTISQTMLLQNMYQNPVINAPLGPDGLPTRVDEKAAQQEYEVRVCVRACARCCVFLSLRPHWMHGLQSVGCFRAGEQQQDVCIRMKCLDLTKTHDPSNLVVCHAHTKCILDVFLFGPSAFLPRQNVSIPLRIRLLLAESTRTTAK